MSPSRLGQAAKRLEDMKKGQRASLAIHTKLNRRPMQNPVGWMGVVFSFGSDQVGHNR